MPVEKGMIQCSDTKLMREIIILFKIRVGLSLFERAQGISYEGIGLKFIKTFDKLGIKNKNCNREICSIMKKNKGIRR